MSTFEHFLRRLWIEIPWAAIGLFTFSNINHLLAQNYGSFITAILLFVGTYVITFILLLKIGLFVPLTSQNFNTFWFTFNLKTLINFFPICIKELFMCANFALSWLSPSVDLWVPFTCENVDIVTHSIFICLLTLLLSFNTLAGHYYCLIIVKLTRMSTFFFFITWPPKEFSFVPKAESLFFAAFHVILLFAGTSFRKSWPIWMAESFWNI